MSRHKFVQGRKNGASNCYSTLGGERRKGNNVYRTNTLFSFFATLSSPEWVVFPLEEPVGVMPFGPHTTWAACRTQESSKLSASRVFACPNDSHFPEITLRILCNSNLNKLTHFHCDLMSTLLPNQPYLASSSAFKIFFVFILMLSN